MVEDILIKDTSTDEVLELSMLTTPFYILSSVDWGTISATHHSYKYVNQIGEYVTDTALETRPLTIVGHIIAMSEGEMNDRKMFINKLINPLHLYHLEYKDYILKFLPNETVKYSSTFQDNNDVICKFQINAICVDPLFSSKESEKFDVATTHPEFHFPLVLGDTPETPGGVHFGVRTQSVFASIFNKGAVETGMTIVFKANGTVGEPSLVNVNTQETLTIKKSMTAGEIITVITETGRKSVRGNVKGQESNYFKYMSLDSTWLQLAVGDNLFKYDAKSNVDNLEVSIYHNDKWLEVQQCK